ncbi:TIGR03943 family putative permease subunit [Paenibacillus hexagrammi]|uniref:TIGR03943 family protein n=1 Tax=Paenibacillus hexagrammi TaxID=2908839 RepID=A0ABY3SRE1_9BACL|nr:TIGR03943 family protein [Paenibacillus sp. YPD9-1]UJF35829.1 TIGR03943 family protein [Paenibacillus sp. YPD9-1]
MLRAAILLSFAMLIVHLAKSEDLVYYIAPRMQSYVKYSSVGLYIIAIYQVYLGIQSLWRKPFTFDCDCNHSDTNSRLKSTVTYSLFILPLLLGFLLPNNAMSSAVADQKGMNLSASSAAPAITKQLSSSASNTKSDLVNQTQSSPLPAKVQTHSSSSTSSASLTDEQIKKLFTAPDAYTEDFAKMGIILYKRDRIVVKPDIYMEILSTVDLFKENFYGKEMELTGFVYREDGLKDDQFIVGRFAVSCCSADALPYGVLVDFPTANHFTKDAWVKVIGTIEPASYQDNDIFKIHASQIESIPDPGTPYVYPNFDPIPELKK